MNQRDIRSLDIGMLRTFDALMREKSVSRAAAQLMLSQPAVSASLNRLREVFGDPLFSRTSYGMVPTARAHALSPRVALVLEGVTGLLDSDAAFDPSASTRVFRMTGSDHASRVVLPSLMRTLAQCGSQVRIVWETLGPWPLAERLRKRELDLGVVARILSPRDMQTELLYEDHYVYVTRHGHPQCGEAVTLDSFCATPQVFLGYGTSSLEDIIEDVLQGLGRQRLAQIAVNSFGQLVELLQRSDHGAVIASRVARSFSAQLQTHALPFELPTYRQFICTCTRVDEDAGIRWLAAQVRQIIGSTVQSTEAQ